jgi:hypothetical protein
MRFSSSFGSHAGPSRWVRQTRAEGCASHCRLTPSGSGRLGLRRAVVRPTPSRTKPSPARRAVAGVPQASSQRFRRSLPRPSDDSPSNHRDRRSGGHARSLGARAARQARVPEARAARTRLVAAAAQSALWARRLLPAPPAGSRAALLQRAAQQVSQVRLATRPQ